MKSKGISLIVLIITIIVIIILAGAVILSLVSNNPFIVAKKSVFQSDLHTFQNELNLYVMQQYTQTKGEFQIHSIDTVVGQKDSITNGYQITTYLTIESEKYLTMIGIENGRIVVGENATEQEKEWATELGYLIKGYVEPPPVKSPVVKYTIKDNANNVMDEQSDNVATLIDDSGKNNNMTLTNISYSMSGMNFNGTSSYGIMASSKLNLTYPVTISMIVKWENSHDSIIFLDPQSKICIGSWNGELLVSGTEYSNTFIVPPDFFTAQKNYLTVVYNTSVTDAKVYVNGMEIQRGTTNSTWGIGTTNAYIGKRDIIRPSYFKGKLYEFTIYNKVLSAEEIAQKYQSDKDNIPQEIATPVIAEYNMYKSAQNSPSFHFSILSLVNTVANKGHAAFYNAPLTPNKDGITFNGTSSYGIMASSELNLTYPTTVSMIVKWENSHDSIIFLDPQSKICIGSWNGELLVSGTEYSNTFIVPPDFFTAQKNYLTVVYNTSVTDAKVYVNGMEMQRGTTNTTWNIGTTNAYLGKRDILRPSYFKGILYELTIYNEKLTENEVLDKYQQQRT